MPISHFLFLPLGAILPYRKQLTTKATRIKINI